MAKPVVNSKKRASAERRSRSEQRVGRRHTKAEQELAAKISNDIAEGIDCGESRQVLRMAVAHWTDEACDQAQRREVAESKLSIIASAKAIMDAAMPPTEDFSHPAPK